MSSIVTENFKRDILNSFVTELTGGTVPYYIGLGRSEPWENGDSPDIAQSTTNDQTNLRRSLQAVTRVNKSSLVVPRYTWTSGTTYSQYDDTKAVADYVTPFYVISDNNDVYICLRTGRDSSGVVVSSSVQPTGSNNDPFVTADGYVWKYLYTVSALDASLFLSFNYMPVKYQASVDSYSTGNEIKQYEIQNTAKSSMIASFIVDSGGLGYTDPTLSINGVLDSPAIVDFTLSGGVIKKVEYVPDSSTLAYVYNLKGAVLTIQDNTGTGAVVRPVLTNTAGIGANAISDLQSTSIMLSVNIPGAADDFIVNQDYRQISVIKGIKDSANGTVFTQSTGNSLYSLELSTETVAFTVDNTIVGTTSSAKAYIDEVDSWRIYYHQNDETGYLSFSDGEAVTEIGGLGAGVIGTASIPPEVDAFTGDILYFDNRAPIERAENQTESIKIVIQLEDCI